MRSTVVWQPRAERELAKLWENSRDRSAVTRAADRSDDILASMPDRVGEERSDGRRVMFDDPLGIRFRVFLEDRLVRVSSVWDITRH